MIDIKNMSRPTKKRDCIIAICAAAGCDVDTTNDALRHYNDFPGLDEQNNRDKLVMEILKKNNKVGISATEINICLIDFHCLQIHVLYQEKQAQSLLGCACFLIIYRLTKSICESNFTHSYLTARCTIVAYKFALCIKDHCIIVLFIERFPHAELCTAWIACSCKCCP